MIQYFIKPFHDLTPHELYSILKLRQDVFLIEQECIYEDCDLKDFEALHLFGIEDDSLVSYCRILPKGLVYENYCAIGRVLTAITHRKKGLGRELMLKSIEYCASAYKDDIKISAQSHLELFYASLGFITISEVYLEDNIPHVAMLRKAKTG